MLPARPVLWEQARPVSGAAPDLSASRLLLDADLAIGPDRAHGSLALADEPRPGVSTHDAEFPHLLVPGAGPAYAAVPQVEAEQIRVDGTRLGKRRMLGASRTHDTRIYAWFGMLAPFTQRCAVDSGRHANARRLNPHSIRAIALRRTSERYIIILWQAALTIRRRECSHCVGALSGAPGGIRTHTARLLRARTLPIGLPGLG